MQRARARYRCGSLPLVVACARVAGCAGQQHSPAAAVNVLAKHECGSQSGPQIPDATSAQSCAESFAKAGSCPTKTFMFSKSCARAPAIAQHLRAHTHAHPEKVGGHTRMHVSGA